MKINLALIALGTAVLAAPAVAETNAADQNRAGTAPAAAKEKKYCLQYEPPLGSRISKQACKTKSEWAKEDIDVEELLKRK